MPADKLLVLDANILIRAVHGKRVRYVLTKYGGAAGFLAPDTAFAEVREHLPAVLFDRNESVEAGLMTLDAIAAIVQRVDSSSYSQFESVARRRMARRDIDDWPVLAAALAFQCPIWTEDADFFGAGVATWTSDRIEMFFETEAKSES
jgi:predicted nucleic acid-binding protein